MNLLEYHIKEIYKEISIKKPDWDNKNRNWVHAYYKTECYGIIEDKDMIYPVDVWEEIKERGYYLG